MAHYYLLERRYRRPTPAFLAAVGRPWISDVATTILLVPAISGGDISAAGHVVAGKVPTQIQRIRIDEAIVAG